MDDRNNPCPRLLTRQRRCVECSIAANVDQRRDIRRAQKPDGKVTYISADALTDSDKRTRFYVVRVEVPAQALERANRLAKEPVALGPGLRTEVYIRTHARSAFDYLLEPVRDGIRKSMRD